LLVIERITVPEIHPEPTPRRSALTPAVID